MGLVLVLVLVSLVEFPALSASFIVPTTAKRCAGGAAVDEHDAVRGRPRCGGRERARGGNRPRASGVDEDDGGCAARSCLEALVDARDASAASRLVAEDCAWTDTEFHDVVVGESALRRRLGLVLARSTSTVPVGARVAVDGVARDGNAVALLYRLERDDETLPRGTTVAIFRTNDDGLVSSLFSVKEPSDPKPGDAGLKVLRTVASLLETLGVDDDKTPSTTTTNNDDDENESDHTNVVERYYASWNRRDMESASACFDEDCVYEDTQYPDALRGRTAIRTHLESFADVFPPTFRFVVDDLVVDEDDDSTTTNRIAARWHLENNGEELPFTRGASFYETVVVEDGRELIVRGVDVPEPPVVKPGSVALVVDVLRERPVRLVPIVVWVVYVVVVFFSDGVLPGANALALEPRTWEEVRDLSLNFFLVAPLLHLPFSPEVHPGLEGIFNLLLSWAALFSIFLSDERDDKPNLMDLRPTLVGMQFLTSAFLLPYLALRTEEPDDLPTVYREDLADSNVTAVVSEWRPLGAGLGLVGTGSIAWGLFARHDHFGDLADRCSSLTDLLSIDRVGSSFVVDLAIFAAFQGWFVDDDMRRRGVDVDAAQRATLRRVAKYLPFFGLVVYSLTRPPLPDRSSTNASS